MIYSEEFALDTEDYPYKASREEMKIEAIERMELLGVSEDIIRKFMDEDAIYESFPPDGRCELLDDAQLAQARDFEKRHNALVYFAIRSFPNFEGYELELASHLFVSQYSAEWPMERAMIRKDMCCYVTSYMLEHPGQAEIGEVLVEKTAGPGLVRLN